MSNYMDLLGSEGGVRDQVNLTPTKEEKADASSERKRSSTEMSNINIGPVNLGASTSTDSSPAKKKMEAMKNKHPNASKSNQVVPIASLFLGNRK